MSDLVVKVLRLFGVNRAIGYGVLTRVWGALAGPVTILLVATRFSKVEQGYYYTFSSLLALQIFFELGLLTVMAQFAAHEFAFLSWGQDGEVLGEERNRQRFLDLLFKGVKWYAISALLLVVILIPAGLFFFGAKGEAVDFSWRLPWTAAVIGVAVNLLVIPFNAVVTGSGDVAFTNRQQMVGGMAGSLLSWLIIAAGGGLYAIPAVNCGTFAAGAIYLAGKKPELIRSVWRRVRERMVSPHQISWWGEVWPMQWKIALSWVSGYFIFQLFTPVLFHYQGAVVAGQMGMTLSATNALMGIGLTWINAKNPEFCKLIAVRSWGLLDSVFFKALRQVMLVACAGSVAGWLLIWQLQDHYARIGGRFLPSDQAAILIATVVINIAVYALATYLRAHKEEPLMWLSLAAALIQAAVTVVTGKYCTSLYVAAGYFFVTLLFVLPMVALIWSRCRRQWHQPAGI